MKRNGEQTDRISVFVKTRTKSNREVGDDESAEIISQLNEGLSQFSQDQQTHQVIEVIFGNVMGPDHHGYAQTYGFGPSPTDIQGSSSSDIHLREELGTLQQEHNNLKEAHRNLNEAHNNLKQDHNNMKVMYDEVVSFLQVRFPEFAGRCATRQVPDASSGHRSRFQFDSHGTNNIIERESNQDNE